MRYAARKKQLEASCKGLATAFDLSKSTSPDDRHRRKRADKIKLGTVTKEELKAIIERDSGCCIYCGQSDFRIKPYVNDPRGFDHLIPLLSEDGRHESWNLAVCCPDCNYKKGQATLLDYDAHCGFPRDHFKQIPDRAFGLDEIELDEEF
jgi:5-methylcytosine-specific restriction endonuclease McrA